MTELVQTQKPNDRISFQDTSFILFTDRSLDLASDPTNSFVTVRNHSPSFGEGWVAVIGRDRKWD
eukprot:9476325-Pyramimonas_sp.AAC.1